MSEFNTARSPLSAGATVEESAGTATAAGAPRSTPFSGSVPAVEKSFLRRLLTGTLLASDPSTSPSLIAAQEESMRSWGARKVRELASSMLGFFGFDLETSPTLKAIVGFCESIAGSVASLWDTVVKALVSQRILIYERPQVLGIPLVGASGPILVQSFSSTDSSWLKSVKEDVTHKKLLQAFEQAMREYAEAIRREEKEEAQDKLQGAKEREDAIREAKQIIRQIDQLNGSNPDNPRVRHILATLEAPGVCIASAIEMVKQLQLEEIELA